MAEIKEVHESMLDMVSIRLVKDAPLMGRKPIKNPGDAVELLGEYLCKMDREVICIINLRTDGCPINCSICSIGTLDGAMVNPREIMKAAILSNAASILMLHNHPSSNMDPSKDDAKITDRMVSVCEIMGIPLVDHIIVGGDNSEYFSFKEKGIMPMKALDFQNDHTKINIDTACAAEDHGVSRSRKRR